MKYYGTMIVLIQLRGAVYTADSSEHIESFVEDNKFYFTMPANDITFRAWYNPARYATVNYDENAVFCGIAGCYAVGETINFYCEAKLGYAIESVTVNGEAIEKSEEFENNYTFTMPDEDIEIVIDYTANERYNINAEFDYNAIDSWGYNSIDGACEGYNVVLEVNPHYGIYITDIIITTADGTVVESEFIEYSEEIGSPHSKFVMPASDVNVEFIYTEAQKYNINDIIYNYSLFHLSSRNYRETEAEGYNAKLSLIEKNCTINSLKVISAADGTEVESTFTRDTNEEGDLLAILEFVMPNYDVEVVIDYTENEKYNVVYGNGYPAGMVRGTYMNFGGSAFVDDNVQYGITTYNKFVVNSMKIVATDGTEVDSTFTQEKTSDGFVTYSIEFTMPAYDVEIVVDYTELHTYKVDVSTAYVCEGFGGLDWVTLKSEAVEGESITVNGLYSNPGYPRLTDARIIDENGTEIESVLIYDERDPASVVGITFTMPACAVKLETTAEANQRYKVKFAIPENIDSFYSSMWYNQYIDGVDATPEGSIVTFYMVPKSGYMIEKVTATATDGTVIDALVERDYDSSNYNQMKATFTMPASDVEVKFEFSKLNEIKINWNEGLYSVSWNNQYGNYGYSGEEKIITVDSKNGYKITNAYILASDGSVVESVLTYDSIETDKVTGLMFTMPGDDVTLYVESIAFDYKLTAISTGNGAVTPETDTYKTDEIVDISVTPDEGYVLDSFDIHYAPNGFISLSEFDNGDGSGDGDITVNSYNGKNLLEEKGIAPDDVYGVQVKLNDVCVDGLSTSAWYGGIIGTFSMDSGWKDFFWRPYSWDNDALRPTDTEVEEEEEEIDTDSDSGTDNIPDDSSADGNQSYITYAEAPTKVMTVDNTKAELTKDGVITYFSEEPLFAADDNFLNVWFMSWGEGVVVDEINVLGKDGNVILGDGEEGADYSLYNEGVACGYIDGTSSSLTLKVTEDIDTLNVTVKGAISDWEYNGVIVTRSDGTSDRYMWGGKNVTWDWFWDESVPESERGVNSNYWIGTTIGSVTPLAIPVDNGSVVEFITAQYTNKIENIYTVVVPDEAEIINTPGTVEPGRYVEMADGSYNFGYRTIPCHAIAIASFKKEATEKYEINVETNKSIAGYSKNYRDSFVAQAGDKVEVTLVPKAGFNTTSISVKDAAGNEIEKVYSLDKLSKEIKIVGVKFVMPASEVTITSEYVAIPYDLYTRSDYKGTVTSDKSNYVAEEEVTLTLTPDEGYELDKFVLNRGVLSGISTSSLDNSDGEADGHIKIYDLEEFIPALEESNYSYSDIYGLRVKFDIDPEEFNDSALWIGGGIGANANEIGWYSVEWGKHLEGFDDKPVVIGEDGVIEWINETPLFVESDGYMGLWVQTWGGTTTVLEMDVLGKNGEVLFGDSVSSEEALSDSVFYCRPTPDNTSAFSFEVTEDVKTIKAHHSASKLFDGWLFNGLTVTYPDGIKKAYVIASSDLAGTWIVDGVETTEAIAVAKLGKADFEIPVEKGAVVDFYSICSEFRLTVEGDINVLLGSSESPYTLTENEDGTYTVKFKGRAEVLSAYATFKESSHTIKTRATINGTLVSDKIVADTGETVHLSITPNGGFTVDKIAVNTASGKKLNMLLQQLQKAMVKFL